MSHGHLIIIDILFLTWEIGALVALLLTSFTSVNIRWLFSSQHAHLWQVTQEVTCIQ